MDMDMDLNLDLDLDLDLATGTGTGTKNLDNDANLGEGAINEVAATSPISGGDKNIDLVSAILSDLSGIPDTDEIQEVDISQNIDASTDSITLVQPNQHYREMYQQVRDGAKEAKQVARDLYLTSKNIKKGTMLESLSDTSEDSFQSLSDQL